MGYSWEISVFGQKSKIDQKVVSEMKTKNLRPVKKVVRNGISITRIVIETEKQYPKVNFLEMKFL